MKKFLSYDEVENLLQERQYMFFLKWVDCGIDDGSVMSVFDRNLMDKQSVKPGLKSNLSGQVSIFPLDE